MKPLSVLLLLLSTFFISCGQGSDGAAQNHKDTTTAASPAPKPVYDSTLPRGKVTDSIACKSDGSQLFALYLPSYYTPDKSYPCIYFFDSHGIGALPLSMYHDLAEKYGFILIGSDISRNGIAWEEHHHAARTMMADAPLRFNIDSRRVYTCGFSGGSRVAVTVAILDGGVAGVIGCSAGFPKVQCDPRNTFDYFGTAGAYDFNYTEMLQWESELVKRNFNTQLLTFPGKHKWPATGDMNTAMMWLQARAMSRQLQPENDTLTGALNKDYKQRIAHAIATKDWLEAYELLGAAAKTLDGLTDVTAYRKQMAGTDMNADAKNAAVFQVKLSEEEQQQQQQMAGDITVKTEKELRDRITIWNNKARQAKSVQEANMNKRLVHYFGFLAYSAAVNAINAHAADHALTFIHLFRAADPDNPDGGYLMAQYYVLQNDTKKALGSLDEAATKGYIDINQLMADPAFAALHSDPAFILIVDKVRANRTKK